MMDAQESIKIGGVEYTLKNPGHLALMNAARQYILRDRPNPLVDGATAIADLPTDIPTNRRAVLIEEIRTISERAMLARNRVTAQDIGFFLDTREGIIFTFWQFCSEVETFDQAAELVEQMFDEQGEKMATAMLQAKIDTAAGFPETKNSSGPDPSGSGPDE